MKRDGVFSFIKLDAIKAWLGSFVSVENILRYNSPKTFLDPQDIPDYATVQALLGSGINSNVYSESDLVSDGGGGFYLPYELTEGEILLGILIDYGSSKEMNTSPSYDFIAEGIGGFVNDDPQSIKVFATGQYIPPAPPPPAPVFSLQPISAITIVQGDELNLSAAASDTNGYQWYKNGIAIPGATSQNYTISPFVYGDDGTYKVTAIGAGGATDSTNSVVSYDSGRAVFNRSNKKSDNSPNGIGRSIVVFDGIVTRTILAGGIGYFHIGTTQFDIKQSGVDSLTVKDVFNTFAPALGGDVSNLYNAPFAGPIYVYNDN